MKLLRKMYDFKNNGFLNDEIIDWCREENMIVHLEIFQDGDNVFDEISEIRSSSIDEFFYGGKFYFSNIEDEIFFKMRWS